MAHSEGAGLLSEHNNGNCGSRAHLVLQTRVVHMPTNQRTFNYKDLLPRWSYVQATAKLADSPEFRDGPVPMGLCVGPAVPLARLAIVVMLLVKIWLAALAHMTAQCRGEYVYIPVWVRALSVPICLALLCVELECMRYALVSYCQVTGRFFLMGCKVSFKWWLIFAALQSSMNAWDKCNDSITAGVSLLAMEYCHNKELDEFWRTTRMSSVAGYNKCVVFVWAFSFVQVIYPLMVSTPHCTDRVDYCIGSHDAAGEPLKLQYKDMLGVETNLGNALYILASGQGFMLLNTHNPWYPRSKAELTIRRAFDAIKALSYVQGSLRRCFTRVCLKTLLENALQLHLQVVLLSFDRLHGTWLLSLVTIIVNLAVIFNHVHDVKDTLSFAREVQDLVSSCSYNDDHVKRKQWLVWRLEFTLQAACVLLSVIVTFALFKIWFTFTCSPALWEFGVGCVDFRPSES
eukprot:CAMPEP_0171065278 /NCGR_PEP_ID=MMETSP0766_2-20121228/6748_1 /TAXON_ID=439317 /ORGANISM="Gambierdiscus australes, Strain CAWD 149" /LENGTH=458 /DNA_ID=CAMNT_0011521355 /DNA_START=11 /DNA_END=1387 /DNA_ORIENTATION=-